MARDLKAQGPLRAAKWLVIGVFVWGLTDPVLSEPMPASVRQCRSQVDEAERLRCYDAVVDSSAPAGEVPPPPGGTLSQQQHVEPPQEPRAVAEASSPATAAAVVGVGRTAPAKAARTNMPMFSAKVAAISFRPSGAANLTLDNGQVWTQYGPEGRVPLRTGDVVTVRPGLFGASVLVGPSGWITKVHAIDPSANADRAR